jgi:AcrR family transcriptional regulator
VKKSEATRQKILEAALRLFRKRGFERTTMRDVAKAAGVALGAAYYYFPSKDALVLAYYDGTQEAHTKLAREGMKLADSLEGRLRVLFHTKLDGIERDRKLLSALFRSVGDPSSELSIFSKQAKRVRDESIALFQEALEPEDLPPELRTTLSLAFWSLSMGLVLYFIHDTSPKQEKTRRLIDDSVALLTSLMPVAPLLAPASSAVLAVLRDAGLSPDQ